MTKTSIPYLLVLLRFLLAPTILLLAYGYGDSVRGLLIVLIVIGLLSDVFDGIIARRLGVSTTRLRRLDSQTDLIFWLSVGVSAYVLNPEVIRAHGYEVGLLFVSEGLCYAISFIKFGKETCTHAFLSKLWGVCLFIAFIALIGWGYAGVTFALAIYWGFFSQADVILILLLLPHWQNDIPSAYHAYLIRKGIPFKKSNWLNS